MDVIGALLRSSLLTELGDDEDRVGRVRGAVDDLSVTLAGKSRGLIPYALVAAIDESTPAGATPLVAAERALLGRWETFRNAFPEQPTEILRAVTLAAVVDAAAGDEALLQAGWYVLRTAVERLPAGRWATPVTDLAAAWTSEANDSLAAIWSPPVASISLRMPAISTVEPTRVAKSDVLNRAAELSRSGNWQNFAQGLMPMYAQHVEALVGISETTATEVHKRSVAQLREFASAVGTKLREAVAAHDQNMNAVRLRSELLWWRQTAFCPRLSRAYQDLDPADLAIAAAVDVHDIVPPIAPLSVEHLLADLVQSVLGSVDVTMSVLAKAEQTGALPAPCEDTPATMIDAIRLGIETPVMPSRHALSAGRAAVLIFRDLQARRLTATKPSQPDEGE